MKKIHLLPFLAVFATLGLQAQTEEKIAAKTYYKQRALEDAKYEQEFTADDKITEEEFWDEQQAYEKDLKKRDRKAYRAYMKGKRDAYAEHYNHCDDHCHHSTHYYSHATYYYYGYNRNYYRPSNRTTIRTSVRVPSVRVGVGIL
ncbi:hypothetical protein [Cellulophaga baltica]|uniref:Uncharacterized protein n=1 Tax=Cellulophaga baltica TaxID=76594 RepID=A0A1G7DCD4_9FLAO|nr:hypothetical protein [Cellulophaga baltica]AIY12917.1 hypothetical protein M667_06665 [Cellulophaga baltica NN016038]SDE48630.1 hypothetical protein SAMN04487992_101448 [Cellulophaga baltica]